MRRVDTIYFGCNSTTAKETISLIKEIKALMQEYKHTIRSNYKFSYYWTKGF